MDYDVKERWIELCEKAAVEKNTGKLLAFMTEINSLLAKDQTKRALVDPGTPPERRSSRAEAATSRKTRES